MCSEGKEALIVVLLVTTEAAFQGVSYASDKSTRRWLWTWWYHGIPCEGVCVWGCVWVCACDYVRPCMCLHVFVCAHVCKHASACMCVCGGVHV